jgi:putative endonuclease
VNRAERGRAAEDAALAFLQSKGLQLRERNASCRWGELDLVMQDGDTLVFVEVRYRHRSDYGGAAGSVDARKQAKLIRASLYWLQRHAPNPPPCRFDVVSVTPDASTAFGHLDWLRDAFRAD